MADSLASGTRILAGAALLVCVGCSRSDAPTKPGARAVDPAVARLVGVWTSKVTGEAQGGTGGPQTLDLEVTVEFKDDGTMTMAHLFPLSGTWELVRAQGNNLTIKTVLEGPSELSWEQKTEGGKTKRISKVKTEKRAQEFAVVFENDDRITMNPPDDPTEAMRLERRRSP